MPESIRICGVCTVPAERITSWRALITRPSVSSTPTARLLLDHHPRDLRIGLDMDVAARERRASMFLAVVSRSPLRIRPWRRP
jgi:hypothetical protein